MTGLTTTIMNYENRGKWGESKYRGNCSGWVIHDLLKHYQPAQMLEIFAGSGTGYQVARDLGYSESVHLDLNPKWGAWNALTDEIPEGSDFVFLHPPYHDIVRYSGEVWGEIAHPDDLSRCRSYEDFIKKLDIVHAKAYSSLRNGGKMAILIGDVRKQGRYYSIQKDMTYFGEMDVHIIKQQHNCVSDGRQYNHNLIRITHEHLLVFRKENVWVVPLRMTYKTERDIRESMKVTWRDLVQATMESVGGKATTQTLYNLLERTEKAKNNPHWKEKIRQTLQIYTDFESIERGNWRLRTLKKEVA